MDFVAGGMELLGALLLGNKSKWGFISNFFACLTWIYVAFHQNLYGLLLVAIPGVLLNVRNYLKWRSSERIEDPADALPFNNP